MWRWYVLESLAKKHGWTRGAEIGVLAGRTLFHLLDNCPGLTMIAVDTWPAEIVDKDGRVLNLVRTGEKFRAKAYTPEYTDRCIVLHGKSADMAWDVKDGTLDFVFIDADHSLPGVRADIAAWAPKVKPGGMVLGHDINWQSVRTAVREAFGTHTTYANNVWGVKIPAEGWRAERVAKASGRWSAVGSWRWRAKRAAALIDPGSSVLDIGCGEMDLLPLLPPGCRYTGADVVKRTGETVVADLEAGEFPDGQYDTVVMLGVLEYLPNVRWVLDRARSAAPEMVLSYCTAMPGASLSMRQAKGWVNHFTEDDLLVLLTEAGWSVAEQEVVQPEKRMTHVQVVMKCRLATPS